MTSYKRQKLIHTQRKKKHSKGIYVLPNIITSLNLFSGFYALLEAVKDHFITGCLAVLISLILDGLDGKIARVTNSTSRFGMEYDSLTDLVTFGVAPAVLIYRWGLIPYGRLGWLAAFLFVACGALRLARFNIQTNIISNSYYFTGLPIPAAACMIINTIMLFEELGIHGPIEHWTLVALVFLLSFLMVSNIYYLSFKELGITHLKSFNWLVATLLFFILIAIHPQVMGFLLISIYIIGGPIAAKYIRKKKVLTEQSILSLTLK